MAQYNWTVLIVEDTYDDSQVMSKILAPYAVEIHTAANGDECLETLKRVDPTVIITDLAMPSRDGWETLFAVRSNPDTAHIPVVAVTAYHSAEVAEKAVQQGFDGYFPKPVDIEHFIRELTEIIG